MSQLLVSSHVEQSSLAGPPKWESWADRLMLVMLLFTPMTIEVFPISMFFLVVVGSAMLSVALEVLAWRRNEAWPWNPWWFWWLGACAATYLLGELATRDLPRVPENTYQHYLMFAVIGLHLVAAGRRNPQAMGNSLQLCGWIAAASTGLALYQLDGSWPVLDDFAIEYVYTSESYPGRTAGTLGHPIVFGVSAAALAVVLIAQQRRLWYLAALSVVVSVVLSGSRSAWIALFAAIGWLLLTQFGPRIMRQVRIPVGLVMLAVALCLWLFIFGGELLTRLFTIVDSRIDLVGDVSQAARTTRLAEGWAQVSESSWTVLFGHGSGSATAFYANVGFGDNQALTFDNTYLILWFQHGLIFMLLFFAPAIVALFKAAAPGRGIAAVYLISAFFLDVSPWPSIVLLPFTAFALVTPKNAEAP